MKPLEVWTCQRAENLKKKSSKIPKNNYAATMVSAARRQIIGGGAPINKSRRQRRGRRTALVQILINNLFLRPLLSCARGRPPSPARPSLRHCNQTAMVDGVWS